MLYHLVFYRKNSTLLALNNSSISTKQTWYYEKEASKHTGGGLLKKKFVREDRKHFGEYFCMCKDSEGIVALGLE